MCALILKLLLHSKWLSKIGKKWVIYIKKQSFSDNSQLNNCKRINLVQQRTLLSNKYLPYILDMTSEEIYMERENVILKDNENFEYLWK